MAKRANDSSADQKTKDKAERILLDLRENILPHERRKMAKIKDPLADNVVAAAAAAAVAKGRKKPGKGKTALKEVEAPVKVDAAGAICGNGVDVGGGFDGDDAGKEGEAEVEEEEDDEEEENDYSDEDDEDALKELAIPDSAKRRIKQVMGEPGALLPRGWQRRKINFDFSHVRHSV